MCKYYTILLVYKGLEKSRILVLSAADPGSNLLWVSGDKTVYRENERERANNTKWNQLVNLSKQYMKILQLSQLKIGWFDDKILFGIT